MYYILIKCLSGQNNSTNKFQRQDEKSLGFGKRSPYELNKMNYYSNRPEDNNNNNENQNFKKK